MKEEEFSTEVLGTSDEIEELEEETTEISTEVVTEVSTEVKEEKTDVVEEKEKTNIFLFLGVIGMVIVNLILALLLVTSIFWKDIQCSINIQWKPIIYIYPKEDTNVSITVSKPEDFTVTYPKYNNGWNVLAKKDGTLIDSKGRSYYSLYWESEQYGDNKIKSDGFIVEGSEVESFLEEKLEILGLNEREINEFIIYCLPKMQHNKYNYIRFETREEIDNYMPLEVTPVPDTTIRVYMNFKALDEEIELEEQKLEKVTRSGYSVIEWGGSIIE